jgi:predicted DCC family thiol-disulfide oxidoreductase YuxK
VALLPLEDEAAEALVNPLPERERFASWHLVRSGGQISSRGAAGVDLLRALGYARPARAAARIERVIERLYELVAEHRDELGRFVPDGPAPRRFP